jgi:hypothetical protein
MTLSKQRLHQLILIAIIALVSAQVIELLTYIFDAVIGMLGGLIGFALLAFANWKASQMISKVGLVYYVWRALPMLILFVLPFLASYFIDFSMDFSFWILLLRLFLALIIPLAVLLYLDYQFTR